MNRRDLLKRLGAAGLVAATLDVQRFVPLDRTMLGLSPLSSTPPVGEAFQIIVERSTWTEPQRIWLDVGNRRVALSSFRFGAAHQEPLASGLYAPREPGSVRLVRAEFEVDGAAEGGLATSIVLPQSLSYEPTETGLVIRWQASEP